MYFTQLQTTLAGAIAGLISGGIVYVAGQTGLVPPFKTSPAVAFGGMTAMGAAIAALTYQACKVKKVEWEGVLPLSRQIEKEWDYIPHPTDELPPPINSVDKPLPQNPTFYYSAPEIRNPQIEFSDARVDESPTHIQSENTVQSQAQPLIDNPFGIEEEEAQEWITPVQSVQSQSNGQTSQLETFEELWGQDYQPIKPDTKTSAKPKTKTAFGDEFFS
jgi:hypothetical protein